MNAISAIILVAILWGVIALPRNWAAVSMVFGTLFLTMGVGLEVAGLNLFAQRLITYVCFLRVFSRGEFSFRETNKVDKALVILYLFTTVILLTRPDESIPLRLAKMLDTLLTYFAFRGLLRSPQEFKWLLSKMALLLVPYVALLAVESALARNFFELVGSHGKVWFREGLPRCFGSFRHPSILGSLGACFLPLFVGLAWDPTLRKRAILGAGLCVAVVGFSNSGGPIGVLLVAVIGCFMWPLRMKMQSVRWYMLGGVVALAFLMKAPIWYLPSKASALTGGSGWHRSYLMDVAFRNIDKWWFLGLPLEETKGWLPYDLGTTGGADITNQFLSFGLNAGVLAIVLFLILFYRAFSFLGRAMDYLRQRADEARSEEALLWGLGVALATHIFNWLGITYYDQFYVLWLLQLAALVSLSHYWLSEPQQSGEPPSGAREDDAETLLMVAGTCSRP